MMVFLFLRENRGSGQQAQNRRQSDRSFFHRLTSCDAECNEPRRQVQPAASYSSSNPPRGTLIAATQCTQACIIACRLRREMAVPPAAAASFAERKCHGGVWNR